MELVVQEASGASVGVNLITKQIEIGHNDFGFGTSFRVAHVH